MVVCAMVWRWLQQKNSERRDEFDVLLFTRHKEKIVFSVWFELLGK